MTQADRFNEGKPQYSLLSLEMLEPCVRGLEYGAKKYDRSNFKKGFQQSKLVDSLMRHISALLEGQITDEESGLSHIAHIQCNAMFLGNPNNTKDLETNAEPKWGDESSVVIATPGDAAFNIPVATFSSEEVPKPFQSTSEVVSAIVDSTPPKLGDTA